MRGSRFQESLGFQYQRDVCPPEDCGTLVTHQDIAGRALVNHTIDRGRLDISFSLSLPRPMRALVTRSCDPLFTGTHYEIPTVPFFVNCYYGPQPTGRRCVELGRAVRRLIARMPGICELQ